MQTMTNRSSIKLAILGTSGSSMATAIFTFFAGVLVARALGPEARGDYGAAVMLAQLATAIGTLSFFDGAIVISRRNEENAVEMLPTLVVGGAAITALSVAAGYLAFQIFDPSFSSVSSQEFLGFAMGLVFLNAFSTMFASVERSRMSFSLVNYSRIAGPALFAIFVGVLWVLTGGEFQALSVLLLFLASKVPFLGVWALKYRHAYLGRVSRSFFQDTFMTGIRLHGAVVLTVLANQMDRILAFSSWEKDQLGMYFVALSAVGAGYSIVTTATRTVLFPYLAEKRSARRTAEIARMFRLATILSTAFVLIGLVVLPFAVPMLYGQDYAAATRYAVALLLASAVLPINALALEVGRASGVGRPSIQMAVVSLAIILAGYWLTGYKEPMILILFVGVARVFSTAVGIWNVLQLEGFQIWRSLLPQMDDVWSFARIVAHRGSAGRSRTSDE